MDFVSLPQIAIVAILLFVDALFLFFFRRLKFTDYLAHIFTGMGMGAVLLLVPHWSTFLPGQGSGSLFGWLVQAGFYFFFMEIAYFAAPLTKRLNRLALWWANALYALSVLVVFSLILIFVGDTLRFSLFLLITAFMITDMSGFVIGGLWSNEGIRTNFADYLHFTRRQEFLGLILFILLMFAVSVRLPRISEFDALVVLLLLIVALLLQPRPAKRVAGASTALSLSYLIVVAFLGILYLGLRLHLPPAIMGALSGFLLRYIIDRHGILFDQLPFRVFRMLGVFPFVGIGLALIGGLRIQLVFFNLVILFLGLLISNLALAFYWLKNGVEMKSEGLALFFRSEIPLLILYSGYLLQLFNPEWLAAGVLYAFLLALAARAGLMTRTELWFRKTAD